MSTGQLLSTPSENKRGLSYSRGLSDEPPSKQACAPSSGLADISDARLQNKLLLSASATSTSSSLFPTLTFLGPSTNLTPLTSTSASTSLLSKRSELIEKAQRERLGPTLTSSPGIYSSSLSQNYGLTSTRSSLLSGALSSSSSSSLLTSSSSNLLGTPSILTGSKLYSRSATSAASGPVATSATAAPRSASSLPREDRAAPKAPFPAGSGDLEASGGNGDVKEFPDYDAASLRRGQFRLRSRDPSSGGAGDEEMEVEEEEEEKANERKSRRQMRQQQADETRKRLILKKEALLKVTSVSLVGGPDLTNPDDPTRKKILRLAEDVAKQDAEFILKLTLYSRQILNLRATTTLLLAFCSVHPPCRPFLPRYFSFCVRLPSEWMGVADMVQTLGGVSKLAAGSLPACLRRVMRAKFADFDEYQLAKYNKDKKPKVSGVVSDDDEDDDEDDEDDEAKAAEKRRLELRKRSFNLKRLIRLLHISEPVFHVMALLGKKYPTNNEEFRQSRLPGLFEDDKAGKRLKLPTPETWETQISKHGNKASVWSDLITRHKLPYMATLRNLRNLVLSGVEQDAIQQVCKYISSEKAVINSRMFPFRFFAAFDVLQELEQMAKKDEVDPDEELRRRRARGRQVRGRGQGGKSQGRARQERKLEEKRKTMNAEAIEPLRRALEKAVAVAAAHNVPPMRGRTLVLCPTGQETICPFTGSRGVVRKGVTLQEAGLLFGLMAHRACEDADFVTYNAFCAKRHDSETTSGPTLEAVKKVARAVGKSPVAESDAGRALDDMLQEMLRDKAHVDNLVLLVARDDDEFVRGGMRDWLARYRQFVNPGLMFACVNVAGKGKMGEEEEEEVEGPKPHANDIHLSGFSEQIFQCLVDAGNGGQLQRVENVDKKFKLPAQTRPVASLPPEIFSASGGGGGGPEWRQIRIFISSTFLDMHGERDLINRFVLPELRRRARQLRLDVRAVDLRWGVLSHGANDNDDDDDFFRPASHLFPASGRSDDESAACSKVLTCLAEVERCHLFVGLLGDRYGWKPPIRPVSPTAEEDHGCKSRRDLLRKLGEAGLLKKLELGQTSITAMEMELAMQQKGQAFFFLRDSTLLNAQLPKDYSSSFQSVSKEDVKQLTDLKGRIRSSGCEVFENYPASFGGQTASGQPHASSLEELGQRMLNNLWFALVETAEDLDEETKSDLAEQEAYCSHVTRDKYVPRPRQIERILKVTLEGTKGIVDVNGKPGSGASTLLCKAYKQMKQRPKTLVIPFFSAACHHSNCSLQNLLIYLIEQLSRVTGAAVPASDLCMLGLKDLCVKVASLLCLAASTTSNNGHKLVVLIDGLEELAGPGTNEAVLSEWLPPAIPEGLVLLVSTYIGGKWSRFFNARKADHFSCKLEALDLPERKALARHCLQREHGKQLDESAFNNELNLLVSKRDAANAGYIKLLSSEMASFGSYEQLGGKLRLAGDTTQQLLSQILGRLEVELDRSLVEGVLSMLALARSGLTEGQLHLALTGAFFYKSNHNNIQRKDPFELSSLLSDDNLPAFEFLESPLKMSILLNGLESFLQPTKDSLMSGVLMIKAGMWADAVTERYFSGITGSKLIEVNHRILAAVFHHQSMSVKSAFDSRMIEGLLYHLARAGGNCVKLLEASLSDLCFLQAAASTGLISEFLRHLQGFYLTQKSIREKFVSLPQIREFAAFVQLHQETLAEQPQLLYQLAMNEPQCSPVRKAAQVAASRSNVKKPTYVIELQEQLKESGPKSLLAVKNMQQAEVTVSCAEQSSCIHPEDLLVAHGCSDGSIMINLATTNTELFTLIGHAAPVSALSFLSGCGPSGETCLASGASDGLLCFWDLNSRIRLSSVQAHTRRISNLAASMDGMTLVSVAWDGLIKVWSGRSRTEISCISQNKKPLNCLVFHPQKDYIVVGGWEGVLKIYDLTKLERRAILHGHKHSIQDIKLSKSARRIVSCSLDGTVKVFDSSIGLEIASFQTGQRALSVALDEDDNDNMNVLVGCGDGQVQVWSLHTGKMPVMSIGAGDLTKISQSKLEMIPHGRKVTCACFLPEQAPNLAIGFEDGGVQLVSLSEIAFKSPIEALTRVSMISDHSITHIVPTSACAAAEEKDDVIGFDSFMDWAIEVEDDKHCRKVQAIEMSMLVQTTGNEIIWVGRGGSNVKVHGNLESISGSIVGIERLASFFSQSVDCVVVGTNLGFLNFYTMQGSGELNPTMIKSVGNSGLYGFAVHKERPLICSIDGQGLLQLWNHSSQRVSCVGEFPADIPQLYTCLAFTTLADKSYIMTASKYSENLHLFALKREHLSGNDEEDDDANEDSDASAKYQFVKKGTFHSFHGPVSTLMPVQESSEQLLACLHPGQGVSVWNSKGLEMRFIPSPNVTSLSMHHSSTEPAGNYYLILGEGGQGLRIFDNRQAVCTGKLIGHQQSIHCMSSVRQEHIMYTSCQDQSLRMWNVANAISKQDNGSQQHHGQSVISVVAVKCEEFLALSEDGTMTHWSGGAVLGKEILPWTKIGPSDKLAMLQVCPSGQKDILMLVVGSRQGIIQGFCYDSRGNYVISRSRSRITDWFVLGSTGTPRALLALSAKCHNTHLVVEAMVKSSNCASRTQITVNMPASHSSSDDQVPKVKSVSSNQLLSNEKLRQVLPKLATEWNHCTQFVLGHPSTEGGGSWFTCFVHLPGSDATLCADASGRVHLKLTNESTETTTQQLHDSAITCMEVLTDRLLATASAGGVLRLWAGLDCLPDSEAKGPPLKLVGEHRGNGVAITSLTKISDPKQMSLVTGDTLGGVHIFNVTCS